MRSGQLGEAMEYRIGIDLGGTGIKAGVVDGGMRIVAKGTRPTDSGRPFEVVVSDIAAAAEAAAEAAGIRTSDAVCIGVGTPSFLNPDTGRLVFVANTNWRDVHFVEELQKHLPYPLRVENDANCAVWGERLAGAAKGCDPVLMLTLGTGLGSGLIIGGRLYTGERGMGPEIGHSAFVHGGLPCTCGLSGCLEAYTSVSALIRQTEAAMAAHPASALHRHAARNNGRVSGRTAFDCAREGDGAAIAVVDRYLEYLAGGIGGLINTFRPARVLIGGGLSNEGDYLLGPLNARVGRYVYAYDLIGAPAIVRASLGNDAGIIGAACLDLL